MIGVGVIEAPLYINYRGRVRGVEQSPLAFFRTLISGNSCNSRL
jgi:hypothetical protein